MTFTEKQQQYARLLVKLGVNVQPGQELVVRCTAETAPFVRLVAKAAYEAGAKEVIVHFGDEILKRLRYENAPMEVFESVPAWEAESMNYYAARGAAFLSIVSDDPEAMKGIDHTKIAARTVAADAAFRPYYERMDKNELQWCVAAVPSPVWAKRVFPEKSEEDAVAALWKAIFKTVRVGENAEEKWQEHGRLLAEHSRKLNEKRFKKLRYQNSIGTNFTVGLAQDHIWAGGMDTTAGGVTFFANMPTEEVFTMPDCEQAEGVLKSALPLSHQGSLIRNFTLVFHEGKVVEYHAEEGEETLKMILDTDEGSKRLGEVALVPYDSPISQSGILFLQTLFDENASCHFALGQCYPNNMQGGELLSKEELREKGGNYAMNHVDFMVGTSDLTIAGIAADGTETVIFKDGSWAI